MSADLAVDGLHVERDGVSVLRGIDLAVGPGEIVAILGPNGAGKSTLLAACAGVVAPSAGRVRAAGRVATVLQTPAMADRTVQANVELAVRWSQGRVARPVAAERARSALALLGAEHLADRQARTLSGGEARRVHLARGLVVDPEILLLDEPFAGLDPGTRADLLFDASSALRHLGRATVIVVHDRAEAWALADRVAVLLDGTLAEVGTPEQVLTHPATEAVAAFVGYSGRMLGRASVQRVRPADVVLSAAGPHRATVVRRVPVEDGMRIELASDTASLVAISPAPGPAVGEEVRFAIEGGLTYPRSDELNRGVER